uniref:Amino acid permease/ SLC12A domain-containing protein n=1 Tax=Ciona intestinalis TaxID=7719 RepID=F6WSG2_CIOIN
GVYCNKRFVCFAIIRLKINFEMEQEKSGEKLKLKEKIGLWAGIAVLTSSIVGSGIFVSPGGVLNAVHGSVGISLLVWILCGVVAALSSLCYCELGASLNTSGCDYGNFQLVYGNVVAYVYLITKAFINASAGISIQVFVKYFISAFVGTDCPLPSILIKISSIFVTLSLAFINYRSVRSVLKAEIIFTVGKFLSMGIISVVGIYNLAQGNMVGQKNFKGAFATDVLQDLTAKDIAVGFYQGIFPYAGWMSLNVVAEEMIDAPKNLPRATLLSLGIVTFMYLAVNVGYFSVLTVQELGTSSAVALTFANKALGPMAWLMPVTVCVSTLGNLCAGVLLKSRRAFVAARSGYMPKIFSMIHVKYHTPGPSLFVGASTSIVFVLIGDVNTLIYAKGFMDWIFIGASAASVLILRYTRPDMHRPYKAPIIAPILACLFPIFFLVLPLLVKPPIFILYLVAFWLMILPIYYL